MGSHFIKTALREGRTITALCRPDKSKGDSSVVGVNWIEGRLADVDTHWFEKVDVLVHLAAVGVSPQNVSWSVAMQVNVADSLYLCEKAASAGVKNFVVAGTCMEYGRGADFYAEIPPDASLQPSGPYATSKSAFFTAIRAFCTDKDCNLVYLRPFHFFGEGQFEENFWPALRKAALAGEDFPMTLGEQIRDFIPVEDVASQFLQETERMVNPERNQKPRIRIANVGTGRPQTLREFAEYWWKHWNAKGKLLLGAVPYRNNEVMRYVPEIKI